MDEWFENFSKQYFKKEYDYYYMYDYNKQLHPYKKISTSIEENGIYATIEHDKYTRNIITINFKQFTEDEKNKLSEIVDDNAINRYKIINKTLPTDLLNSDIMILPESLDDLDIECSMDDENDNLIDILSVLKDFNRKLMKNNFLIFKIRGLDLKRRITYSIPDIKDIFNLSFKSEDEDSTLYDLYDDNIVLLQNIDHPSNNFTFIYKDLFKLLNEEIIYLRTKNPVKSSAVYEDITLDINDEYEVTDIDVLDLFYYLNQKSLKCNNDKISYLKELLELTYTLIEYNSLMPQLFKTKDTSIIRWIPSSYSSNVINYVQKYYDKCPSDLVRFNGKSLTKENQVIAIISLLAEKLIRYTIDKKEVTRFNNESDIVFRLFTANKLNTTKDTHQKTLNNIIKQLSVFYLKQLDFDYALYIDDNYDIEIKIKTDNTYKNLEEATDNQLKYINIIYNLFTYFKIENTIHEKIILNNNDFIIFSRNILSLLKYLNIELHNPFEIIESKLDLILDINLDEDEFQLNKISDCCQWKVELTGNEISLSEFYVANDDENPILRINNKLYLFDWRSFNNLRYYSWSLLHLDESNRILQYAIFEKYHEIEFHLTDNFKKLIRISKIYDAPKTLTGQLRPYQKIGYSWLIRNTQRGFGSILADDMGLGKTLQVLACILYFKEAKLNHMSPSLIVVPPTLISNWQQEIEKFTPELSYYIYHGANRYFPSEYYDIILTSYGVIRQDIEIFLDENWFIYVIDEAQNIKNPSTQQTKAIKEIPAFNKIALTGTPIENRLTDYWSIFDFVNKGYLSTLDDFKTRYVKPIEKIEDKDVLNKLKTIAKPFVLRRLKTDSEIKDELPEKIVNDIYCSLTKKQINLYNKLMDGIFKDILSQKGIERKGNILKLITALKQTCNHPAQYIYKEDMKIKDSGKMELLVNVLENILDMDEKVLIFTQYVKMGEIIQKFISEKFKTEVLFLNGTLSQKEKTRVINSFQEDEDYKILVATLKTGGTGLNLTAAQNVIHYDLWWNPSVENQATDRVHRIGQENDVMVYRFITKGTLEEGIDLMIKDKIKLAEETISTDQAFITELTNEQLKEILSLRF